MEEINFCAGFLCFCLIPLDMEYTYDQCVDYFHTVELTLNDKYGKYASIGYGQDITQQVVCTEDQTDYHMHIGQQPLTKRFCLYLISDG